MQIRQINWVYKIIKQTLKMQIGDLEDKYEPMFYQKRIVDNIINICKII